MINVQIMYWCLIIDMPQGLEAVIPVVLDKTKVELKRLLQHPELFPDGAQQWFPQVMRLELRKVSDHVALKYAAGEKEHAKHQERVQKHREGMLPDYDIARTMWQQFLHGKAPGSGVPRNQMCLQGCTQMMTAACVFLALNKQKEYRQYARALEQVGSSLPRIFRHNI